MTGDSVPEEGLDRVATASEAEEVTGAPKRGELGMGTISGGLKTGLKSTAGLDGAEGGSEEAPSVGEAQDKSRIEKPKRVGLCIVARGGCRVGVGNRCWW